METDREVVYVNLGLTYVPYFTTKNYIYINLDFKPKIFKKKVG